MSQVKHPLHQSLGDLRGVGPQLTEKLARIGIHSVRDLLFHLPLRYEDRTRITPIGALTPGTAAVLTGQVELSEVVFRGRRSLLVSVSDGTGSITLRFFYFSKNQQEGFKRGTKVRCYGEVRRGRHGLEMVHPEYRLLRAGYEEESTEDNLTPVYPLTEGIQQGRMRALVTQALNRLDHDTFLEELLPDELVAGAKYPSLASALLTVHRPPTDANLETLAAGQHPAQRRLAFEELLAHHLSLKRLRQAQITNNAQALVGRQELEDEFKNRLGFVLTGAQQGAVNEVFADLAKTQPMMRLVQGDVGSGKTVVAALACLQAVASGFQAAVMAPTELLAEQHFRNFHAWFEQMGVQVGWLSSRTKGRVRNAELAAIQSGQANIVVGTHALFQEDVEFNRLALVVIDEQHRFGVHQRFALQDKGKEKNGVPHQLIMTATPIPRTLAMTAYADLDVTVIDELPPGRKPVKTSVLPESKRAEVVASISRQCRVGHQVYWVCPLIEESEQLDIQAAENTHQQLLEALPELSVGLVHGRMKPTAKDKIMQAFKQGDLNLLVATTVIEVGVDVPNANLMVIENAERLGLAQLHQLRGRVGRGAAEANCFLLYRGSLGAMAKARLSAMRKTTDGFEIAREDLRLRGPGEVLGTRQTGMLQMRIADLVRDADLLPTVQQFADNLLAKHPRQVDALVKRWVGDAVRYASVG
ncbi:MAG: ATP-dependent DNA helicase RecG [Gammaproteobacteria bacterium]